MTRTWGASGVAFRAFLFAGAGFTAACTGSIQSGSSDEGSRSGDPDDPDRVDDPDDSAETNPLPEGPSAADIPSEDLLKCPAGEKAASAPRLWRLTARQYTNTLESLVPGATAGLANPFQGAQSGRRFNNYAEAFAMPEQALQVMVDTNAAFAGRWSDRLAKQFTCTSTMDSACIKQIVADAGRRAFRRPLATEEVDRYTQLVLANKSGTENLVALQTALEAMLNSPNFAFRSELGVGEPDDTGRIKLSPHELASAISYTITDGPPDTTLLRAADEGHLDTTEQVRDHVNRLLDAVENNGATRLFLSEYFTYPGATEIFKDPTQAPFHDADALIKSTDLLLQDLLAQRTSFLKNLLTTTTGFVSKSTAQSYGVPAPNAAGDDDFVRVPLPEGERSGMLTQPSFLVRYSRPEETDPVRRGFFIAKSLLCSSLPDEPPANVPPLPDLGPDATMRDKLTAHRDSNGSCRACHDLMDPMGLGLEAYDDLGRYRTTEKGNPVDATGKIVGSADQDGPFDGALEMGDRLARSSTVAQCFVRHSFRYWMGREEFERDRCSLAAAYDAFRQSDDNVLELLTALLSSDSFIYRTANL